MLELTKQFTAAHNLAASHQVLESYFNLQESGVKVDREFVIDLFLASTLMGGEI